MYTSYCRIYTVHPMYVMVCSKKVASASNSAEGTHCDVRSRASCRGSCTLCVALGNNTRHKSCSFRLSLMTKPISRLIHEVLKLIMQAEGEYDRQA